MLSMSKTSKIIPRILSINAHFFFSEEILYKTIPRNPRSRPNNKPKIIRLPKLYINLVTLKTINNNKNKNGATILPIPHLKLHFP